MNKRNLDLWLFGTCAVWGVIVLPRMATGLWSPGETCCRRPGHSWTIAT
jgi:hypothetical protein